MVRRLTDLDDAGAAGRRDRVADADLVFEQDEKACDDVLDERLRAEADGQAEDPGAGEDRLQIDPELAEDEHDA